MIAQPRAALSPSPPLPALPLLPPPLLAITRGDLSPAPAAPHSREPGWSGGAGPGAPPLCRARSAGAGSATVPPSPRPFEDVSSAMPLPSSAKGSEAAGPVGKAGTPGDQMSLTVKGLARASAWARGPAHGRAPARAPLAQPSQLCHLLGFFLQEKVFLFSAPSCNK